MRTSYRDNVVFCLAKAHQRAQAVMKKHLQEHRLTPVQCLFLESLMEEEGLPVGEIGRRLNLDTATLAGVLDRLVTAGWVRRESDPTDGRIARIYLSDKARESTANLKDTVARVNNELLEKFSHAEKVLLKRFLCDIKT